ncbi:hypothetical protein M0R89_14650 [Halorussus limi]|uniref:Uncharacterized protein n=1 Tax=Halorussus limi TaxID=2938695 RepID=A0A8U0HSP0_9EURY|nr:hypothetical protein [Halorussus limi]UPV73773.1 hypothetical protein M0R89_14650 [Halorussus limi]
MSDRDGDRRTTADPETDENTAKRTEKNRQTTENISDGSGQRPEGRTERRDGRTEDRDDGEVESVRGERATGTDPVGTADASAAETRTAPDDPEDPDETGSDDGGGLSDAAAIAVSALVALVATALAYLWASGWFGWATFYESLFRVAPTVSGGGVGTDWVVGNTVPILDAAIAITHAADVLMGVFILGMVFLHWSIFRRLSTRMRRPARRETGETVATDGGARNPETDGGARDSETDGERDLETDSRTHDPERDDEARGEGGDGP